MGDHFGHILGRGRYNGGGSDAGADISAGGGPHCRLEALATHAEADGDLNLVHTRTDGILEKVEKKKNMSQ